MAAKTTYYNYRFKVVVRRDKMAASYTLRPIEGAISATSPYAAIDLLEERCEKEWDGKLSKVLIYSIEPVSNEPVLILETEFSYNNKDKTTTRNHSFKKDKEENKKLTFGRPVYPTRKVYYEFDMRRFV